MENSKGTVLVIDDDDRLLITTKGILEKEGYQVLTHNQPFGATTVVRLLQPDIILLDINMPALSGNSIAELLLSHERTRNIPILFYSSNDEYVLRRMVQVHGVSGYITKGDLADLKRKVAFHLGEQKEGISSAAIQRET